MAGYRRPVIASATYLDDVGEPIVYGARWGDGSPPTDTYSVTSNLERFRPLHTVAVALIDWLASEFDVEVEDAVDLASDLVHRRDDVVRAVRLTPRQSGAAAITIVFTSFPSVIIRAGALHEFLFPVCGCDACDESWETTTHELEWTVLTIVGGGYREEIDPDREPGIGFWLVEPAVGSRSGRSMAVEYSPDRLEAASRSIPDGAWAAWRLSGAD